MQDLVSVADTPDFQSPAALLQSYEEHLVPSLLLHDDRTSLMELCQGLHGPEAGLHAFLLMYKSFPLIAAGLLGDQHVGRGKICKAMSS